MTSQRMSWLSSTYRGVNTVSSKLSLYLRFASVNELHSLHAVLNQLGSKYAELGLSDQAALATINVDANDVPIEIDSYPSIRLYRAGTNEVVSFKGNFTEMLTVEQLDTFIAQSGSHGVSIREQSELGTRDEL